MHNALYTNYNHIRIKPENNFFTTVQIRVLQSYFTYTFGTAKYIYAMVR